MYRKVGGSTLPTPLPSTLLAAMTPFAVVVFSYGQKSLARTYQVSRRPFLSLCVRATKYIHYFVFICSAPKFAIEFYCIFFGF